MTSPTLKNVTGLGELKQNFRWDIDFSSVATLLPSTPDAAKLSLLCESTDLPRKDINMVTNTFRGGVDVKQAGRVTLAGELTFTFIDNVDNVVEDMIYDWGNIIANTEADNIANNQGDSETGWVAGRAPQPGAKAHESTYKCNIVIKRLTSHRKTIKIYTLVGCSYQSFDPGGQLSAEDDSTTKPSLTISYDGWFHGVITSGNTTSGNTTSGKK